MRRRKNVSVCCFARTQDHLLSIRAWIEKVGNNWLSKPRTAEICFGEPARVSITVWRLGGWTGIDRDQEDTILTNHLAGWGLMTDAMHDDLKARILACERKARP